MPSTAVRPPDEVAAQRLARGRTLVGVAAVLGGTLSAIGVLVGVARAAHRIEVNCPDGQFFPDGTTDFRCFSYPFEGQGVSVAILSAMVGILIGLTCFIAQILLEQATPPASIGDALDEPR